MSLYTQWYTIGMMLLAGAGMGVLFDSYRIVSGQLKFPRWSVSLLDIAYWILSAIVVFRLLYASNYGEVRAYVFIGLALGATFYAMLLSNLVSKLVHRVMDGLKAIFKFFVRVNEIFIVKPVIFLGIFILAVFRYSAKFTIVFTKFMLQLLLPLIKLLLWLGKPLYKPLQKPIQKLFLKRVKPIIQRWTFIAAIRQKIITWLNLIKAWIFG